MSESPFAQLEPLAAALAEGQEMRLPPVQLSHYPIADTALAAALLTMGVPRREPGFYTRHVELDERGNERQALRVLWWVGASSPEPERTYVTEAITSFWADRARFEQKYPLHPLVSMRAAHDARAMWLRALNVPGLLPQEPGSTPCYATDSLNAASLLVACGYRPLARSNRAMFVEASRAGVHAEALLLTAAQAEGATPPQWMGKFLLNLNDLLRTAKSATTIVQQPFGDLKMLLTADATRKTREKFLDALDLF